MILYSIVPEEVVFQGLSGNYNINYREAEYRGEKVLVEEFQENRFRIARLLGTCPRRFLDPAFLPGNIVDRSELKLSGEQT
jgi:hypothetical protein